MPGKRKNGVAVPGAGGRPSKYLKKYCEELVEHMAQGLSVEAFAGRIGITKKTLYNWMDQHPEFLHAKLIGDQKSALWWEQAGRKGLFSGKFSASTWIFNMKNRHGWLDRFETTNTQDIKTVRIQLPETGQEEVISIEPEKQDNG
jgi:transposase-like protein